MSGQIGSYGRLADIVDSVLNRQVRRDVWSVPFLKDELAKEPGDHLRKYRVVFAEGRGVSWEPATSFNAQQKIGVTNVEQWARENLT